MVKSKVRVAGILRFFRIRANYRIYQPYVLIDATQPGDAYTFAAYGDEWAGKGYRIILAGREKDFSYCQRVSLLMKNNSLNLCGQLTPGVLDEFRKDAAFVINKWNYKKMVISRHEMGPGMAM